MSRGLRNNNPGNIRRSATVYKGETKGNDPAFKAFETVAWGYRAMFVVLHTYQVRHGCHTIRDMITRYAPPTENNTKTYIRAVSTAAGIGDTVRIRTTDRDTMIPIVAAMSRVENGMPANHEDVVTGWNLFTRYRP